MNRSSVRRALAFLMSAVAFAIVVPAAAADSVYHTEKLPLASVGGAPLRSGFVVNIKANGPTIYAHEIYVVNGAVPGQAFTVTNNFYFEDPDCVGTDVFLTDMAVITTGPHGNARADAFIVPADVVGFEGVHGVIWTLQDSNGDVVYQTICTLVTLD